MHTVIDELLQREPLARFSTYTAGQVRVLRQLGREIDTLLDEAISRTDDGHAEGASLISAHGKFWLWVLGAYEVLRTMSGAPSCFTAEASQRIAAGKRRLAHLRIPFAKQEYAGNKSAVVAAELSIYNIDAIARDIEFEVRGSVMGARATIRDFEQLIGSITLTDVLADMRNR